MFPLMSYLISLGLLFGSANSDPNFAGVRCVDTVGGGTYQANLNTLLQNLIGAAATTPTTFYSSNVVQGDSPDTTVYGFWYCRGDIQPQDCRACVASAAAAIAARCPAHKEAIIWYEECALWYSNRSIVSLYETDPWIWRRSGSSVSAAFDMNDDRFGQILVNSLDGLVMQAAYNYTSTNSAVKFYGGQTTKLTATHNLKSVAQCSPGTNTSQLCEACLRRLLGSDMTSCCGWAGVWAMLFSPGCLIMYTVTSTTSTVRQTQSSTFRSSSASGKSIVIVVAAAFGAVVILLAIWWWVHGRDRDISKAPIPKLSPPSPPRPTPPFWPDGPVYPAGGIAPGLEHGPTIFVKEVHFHNYYCPYHAQ